VSDPRLPAPGAIQHADAVVRIADGGVVLGGRPVLRGVDLTVGAGEVVAVLGANGSGKTTLVRALLGLTPLRTGQVELFGTPLADFHDHHRIGFVPQRTTATAGVPASVWEVVASGRLARTRPWRPLGRADRAAIWAALEAVALTDRVKDGVAVLSGGQQQRVLIARALAGEPELLVLDEPTAGVDLTSQQSFAAIVDGLLARGMTMLLVAHEMGPLAPLITRTVVMREGRVAYDGPPLESFHGAGDTHAHHPPAPDAYTNHRPQVRAPFDLPLTPGEKEGRP
jgi:zinc transport system ATP-binding protein